MKSIYKNSAGLFLCLCFGLAGCATPPSPAGPPAVGEGGVPQAEAPAPPGTIGPGDLLEVIVRRGAGEDRFAPTVREDGTVSVSFADVAVKGLRPAQAEARIEAELSRFVRKPKVQVFIKQKAIAVEKVFIFGEVKKPGIYPLSHDFTVLQAIAVADGYSETAMLEDVRIIRGGLAQPVILSANIEGLLKRGDLSQNLRLQNNDIVYIPRQKIGDWNAFLAKIKPSLEILIGFPLNTVFQVEVLRELEQR